MVEDKDMDKYLCAHARNMPKRILRDIRVESVAMMEKANPKHGVYPITAATCSQCHGWINWTRWGRFWHRLRCWWRRFWGKRIA